MLKQLIPIWISALTFYERANQGTKLFDNSFVLEYKNEFLANKEKADEYSQKVDAWLVTMPVQTNYTICKNIY